MERGGGGVQIRQAPPTATCTVQMQMAVWRRHHVCFGKIQPFDAPSSRFFNESNRSRRAERRLLSSPSFISQAVVGGEGCGGERAPPPLAATPLECFITARLPGVGAEAPLSSRVHASSLGIITHGLDMRINRMMAFSSCQGTPTFFVDRVGRSRRDGRQPWCQTTTSYSAAGSIESHLSRRPPSRQGGSGFLHRAASGRQHRWECAELGPAGEG